MFTIMNPKVREIALEYKRTPRYEEEVRDPYRTITRGQAMCMLAILLVIVGLLVGMFVYILSR